MSDGKIKVFEEQIKQMQEKRSRLIREKKEKERKKKTEIALKTFEVLENIGIDTEPKMEALRSLLLGNEDFKKLVVDFNWFGMGNSPRLCRADKLALKVFLQGLSAVDTSWLAARSVH